MQLLKIGSYFNIFIAIAHVIGLFWADAMFEATGIGAEMKQAAESFSYAPHLLTIFVAIVFFIFGLYGLSALGIFRKMPFTKLAIFAIAAIYLLRGFGELIFDMAMQDASNIAETSFSLIAIGIGLCYLIGGLKMFRTKQV